MSVAPDLLNEPERVIEIPASKLPALLLKLSALQNAIAARFLEAGGDRDGKRATGDVGITGLITVPEAARRLVLNKRYLYGLIRQKKFPAVRVGKHIRISADDMTAWLERHHVRTLDSAQCVTYSHHHDRKGAPSDPAKAGAYASRVRGPRRRNAEFDRSSGAGRDRHTRTPGPADSTSGGAESFQTKS